MIKNTYSSAQLFQLSFFSKSTSELLNICQELLLDSRKTTYIVTPNPEQIVQATQDREFLEALQAADLRLPDGIGLIWASRVLAHKHHTQPIPSRISGSDLVPQLLKIAADLQQHVFVIGGRGYEAAPTQLGSHVTWLEGYADVRQPQSTEEERIRATITRLKPSIVFVAFGAPWQEKWMMAHRQLLESSGVKLVMAVGGTFDYLLGKVPRAPQLMQRLGLEWLFRLIVEPWRWKRQIRLVQFMGMVMKTSLLS